MATIMDLPDELLIKICSNCKSVELNSVTLTCKKFREITLQEDIWKWFCRRDYKVSEDQLWPGWSYRDFYTKALYKYSCLLGLWRRESEPYGGIVLVKVEKDGFIGYECLPPFNDSFRDIDGIYNLIEVVAGADYAPKFLKRLRLRKTFVIKPENGGVVDFVLRCIVSDNHECLQPLERHWISLGKGGRNYWEYLIVYDECLWDFNFFAELEYGFRAAEGKLRQLLSLMWLNAYYLYQKKVSAMSKWFDYRQYHPLDIPRFIPDSALSKCIKPGFYSGTYGGHGWEIVNFTYGDDGQELIGTKLTGDPNIPAGKVTVRVFLTKRLVITPLDLATFDGLREAIGRLEAERSNGGSQMEFPSDLQPLLIPDGCSLGRPASEIPKFCRWFYLAEGQTATGYQHAGFSMCVFVGFEEDHFGILWLGLRKLSLFYRANNMDTLDLCAGTGTSHLSGSWQYFARAL